MYYKYYEYIEIWTDEINKGFSEQFGKSIVFYDVVCKSEEDSIWINWKAISLSRDEKLFKLLSELRFPLSASGDSSALLPEDWEKPINAFDTHTLPASTSFPEC